MNILISSYYFYPELTPRAFRTTELVKEFCKLGHKVTLYLPQKDCFRESMFEIDNLRIIYSNSCHTQNETNNVENNERQIARKQGLKKLFAKVIPKILKDIIRAFDEWKMLYFFPIQDKEYIKSLTTALIRDETLYDLFISIALPIAPHIAAIKAIRRNPVLRSTPVKVAEYGDPFSRRKPPMFWGYLLVDFIIGLKFNYISVPTDKAVNSFALFKRRKYIKVIPQAFDLSEYKIKKYTKNKLPTFAYAGCFYEKLRNPSSFFEYISHGNFAYIFYVYTISSSRDTRLILDKFKNVMGGRLIVKYDIDRKDIITQLSGCDFLLNFENASETQVPSKLIDYALAKRPICSISTSNYSNTIFEEFLQGNYSNQIIINIDDYDIKKVAKQFLRLR